MVPVRAAADAMTDVAFDDVADRTIEDALERRVNFLCRVRDPRVVT